MRARTRRPPCQAPRKGTSLSIALAEYCPRSFCASSPFSLALRRDDEAFVTLETSWFVQTWLILFTMCHTAECQNVLFSFACFENMAAYRTAFDSGMAGLRCNMPCPKPGQRISHLWVTQMENFPVGPSGASLTACCVWIFARNLLLSIIFFSLSHWTWVWSAAPMMSWVHIRRDVQSVLEAGRLRRAVCLTINFCPVDQPCDSWEERKN
jgi:hypothetical protein